MPKDLLKGLFNLVCRLQREEAKISAWENLQKAKAEAAIRKLEVHPFILFEQTWFCSCSLRVIAVKSL